MALRADYTAAGRPERLTAAGCHHDDTGIRHCRFQREEGLYRIQRIRTAQGSAKGVLHLSFHEKDTARLAQGTRHPGRHQGYLAAEPNLLAQFRPQCGRQQRRQPLHGTALCLFDRFRNRFVDDVGLFGGCLHERYGGQRIPFVLRPESGFGTRTGLDRIPIQAAGRRPGIPQRHLPGREPQTDGLPRLCARRQQRQPAIRSGRRPDRISRQHLQSGHDAGFRHLVRFVAHVFAGPAANPDAHVHGRTFETPNLFEFGQADEKQDTVILHCTTQKSKSFRSTASTREPS